MEIQEAIKNIKFGNYPQTSNDDILPIEWLVLAKEENKMLLLSKYGLDCKIFDVDSNNWENSEIRKWLNGEFYNKAFNEKERKYINSLNLSDVGTTDNVFLLSYKEAEKYFANDNARMCKSTEYTVKNGAWKSDEGYGYWWLRSPNLDYSNLVYRVGSLGVIVDCNCVFDDSNLVRPALWVKI